MISPLGPLTYRMDGWALYKEEGEHDWYYFNAAQEVCRVHRVLQFSASSSSESLRFSPLRRERVLIKTKMKGTCRDRPL